MLTLIRIISGHRITHLAYIRESACVMLSAEALLHLLDERSFVCERRPTNDKCL